MALRKIKVKIQDVLLENLLVLACIDATDSENMHIFQLFSRSAVAPIGRKKSERTFLLPKKRTFGGDKGWQILRVKSASIEGG